MTQAELFRKVKELLSDKNRWTKGDYAKDETGRSVKVNDDNACKWCLYGAVLKICYDSRHIDYLSEYIVYSSEYLVSSGKISSILLMHRNDNYNTTHEEILEFIDELIKYGENVVI